LPATLIIKETGKNVKNGSWQKSLINKMKISGDEGDRTDNISIYNYYIYLMYNFTDTPKF
jgi:hypothetical protein